MLQNHPQICLYKPEIPQNTGNIGRFAAATACRLHLIKPFGFATSDKNLRRAGLDYWPFLDLEIHDHIQPLLEQFAGKVAFLSKKAPTRPYWDIPFDVKLYIFGQETSGLPHDLWNDYSEFFYAIPMHNENVRSFNLANSVAMVISDKLRQIYSAHNLTSRNMEQ